MDEVNDVVNIDKDEEIYATPTKNSPKTILCTVCGGAPSHRHYGGLSCLSCKAFFRRAVTSTSKREKTCSKALSGELCSLDSGQKRACGPCRLKRCLQTGMKAQLVLSGKKEALKHVGRASESTLARLQKLKEESGICDEKMQWR